MQYLEDFQLGRKIDLGERTISVTEIKEFAARFDPQPFHLDEGSAMKSMMRGLSASGWHSCAVVMRMMCDSFLLHSAALGSPGVESISWLKPVRPDAALSGFANVIDARRLKSQPDRGLVTFAVHVHQNDQDVMSLDCMVFIKSRAIPVRKVEAAPAS